MRAKENPSKACKLKMGRRGEGGDREERGGLEEDRKGER